jgi:hypothetical protein
VDWTKLFFYFNIPPINPNTYPKICTPIHTYNKTRQRPSMLQSNHIYPLLAPSPEPIQESYTYYKRNKQENQPSHRLASQLVRSTTKVHTRRGNKYTLGLPPSGGSRPRSSSVPLPSPGLLLAGFVATSEFVVEEFRNNHWLFHQVRVRLVW